MGYCLISYFITIILFFEVIRHKKEKYWAFPKIIFNKNGLCFKSTQRHRIKVDNAKIMQVENRVFIKQENSILILNNVDEVKFVDGYVYFKGKGKVKFEFRYAHMYKYYNIKIISSKIDAEDLKQNFLHQFIENPFENKNKLFSYVSFLKNTLNIKIEDSNIIFGKNKFNISYEAIYKLNGKTKKVIINNNSFN